MTLLDKKDRFSQFEEHNKMGLYDEVLDKVLIPAQYDLVSPDIYDDQLILVVLNDQYGFVDFNNQVVVPIVYDDAREFNHGLAPVLVSGSWGYINRANEFEIEPNPAWEWVSVFDQNMAIVRLSDGYHYIDRTGKRLNKAPFSAAEPFQEEYAIVATKEDDSEIESFHIVNRNFETVSQDAFDRIEFKEKGEFKVSQSQPDGRMKTGTLRIGSEVEWEEGPSLLDQWSDKIELLKKLFHQALSDHSICQFPRIVDYITQNSHYDQEIIRNAAITTLQLKEQHHLGDREEDYTWQCPKFLSEFQEKVRINQRGEPDFAGFSQTIDNCHHKIGAQVGSRIPVAVIYANPRAYSNNLSLSENYYFESVEGVIDYLFEKE